jgi:DNA-binding NarL/FixJ family response regulator
MIRVLLVDDQALVRGGLRMLLEAQDDIEVIGEAADGAEGVAAVRQLKPDVVLLDVRMPNVDGIEAARRILAEPGNRTRVLMLTTFDEDDYVYDALKAGAAGFLLKSSPTAELVRAVHMVHEGQPLLAPEVTKRLVDEYVSHPRQLQDDSVLSVLTEREVEVLRLIGTGRSNAEIGDVLYVSEATVKSHVNRIFAKLHIRDRPQAIVLAYDHGLVRPGG